MSHAIQDVAFVVSNLFHQQHSKVIKPTKRLKSTILECYAISQNTISVTLNALVNQKYHSTLGSITTEKMSKTPM